MTLKKCKERLSHPLRSLMDDTVEFTDEYSNLMVGTECETNFHGHGSGLQDKKSENFTHVVDLDSFEFHKIIVYDFLGQILQSVLFRTFILVLVLINAVLIGLQTVEYYDSQYGTAFSVIDHIILSIFIVEIILKWTHDFRMFWEVGWNVLDFVIILLIVASSVTPNFGNSRALVIVRVVRAFRSLRSVSSLSSLAVVTHTILKSVGDMMSILFVLMIFLVVLAVMGVTLFDIDEIRQYTTTFESPFHVCYVLFVCITQDGWVDYMEQWRGRAYFWLLMIYLVIAIAIGAFIFSNLIIAVVVANLEMGVVEIRAERLAQMNPLVLTSDALPTVDINTTYSVFSKNNLPLRTQRPMKIPSLRYISERRLQAYIQLIVALEQNMLENTLIQTDLEKVMAVIVSIIKQLERFTPSVTDEMVKGQKILKELRKMDNIAIPKDAFQRAELLEEIKKVKIDATAKR